MPDDPKNIPSVSVTLTLNADNWREIEEAMRLCNAADPKQYLVTSLNLMMGLIHASYQGQQFQLNVEDPSGNSDVIEISHPLLKAAYERGQADRRLSKQTTPQRPQLKLVVNKWGQSERKRTTHYTAQRPHLRLVINDTP